MIFDTFQLSLSILKTHTYIKIYKTRKFPSNPCRAMVWGKFPSRDSPPEKVPSCKCGYQPTNEGIVEEFSPPHQKKTTRNL